MSASLKCFFLFGNILTSSVVSICSDSGPGGPPADHVGQRRGAGGLERRRGRSEGLLAHLGGTAELGPRPGLRPLFASRLPVDTPHPPPPGDPSVCVAHLPDGAGRGAVLHGTVPFK